MRFSLIFTMMVHTLLVMLTGCGSSSDIDGLSSAGQADLVMLTRIDDATGFINLADGAVDTGISNFNGTEVDPSSGLFTHDGYVYTTGSMSNDRIAKYAVNSDNTLTKVAETTVFKGGGSIPTNMIFVDDTKAYLILAGISELLVFDPVDLTIVNRIDLTGYAMDADGELGGDDINPEASAGVIRDGKLYLALGQMDTFSSYHCRGKASILIIDVATDEIIKHISDDRTCNSGVISPNTGLVLDENGDIYVNNPASFGYYPGMDAGILRIKNGEDNFDPDYYFSITDLTDLDVPGGTVGYAYNGVYLSNGKFYTTLFVPGLTSNPPDFVNDRNYVPYMLDLRNRTATKLAMAPTIGWSTHILNYNGEIVYAMSTVNGTGLYYVDETMPFMTVQGTPYMIARLE